MSSTMSESEVPINIISKFNEIETEIIDGFNSLTENKPGSDTLNLDATNIALNTQLNDSNIQLGGADDENSTYWEHKYIKYKDLYLSMKAK